MSLRKRAPNGSGVDKANSRAKAAVPGSARSQARLSLSDGIEKAGAQGSEPLADELALRAWEKTYENRANQKDA